MGKLYFLAAGLLGAIVLVSHFTTYLPPEAKALKICNRSHRGTIYVSLAYATGEGWQTEGWITLANGECSTSIQKSPDQDYYYYAETDGEYAWRGKQRFCISREPFTFVNADRRCTGTKSRWERFQQLYTNVQFNLLTLNLE